MSKIQMVTVNLPDRLAEKLSTTGVPFRADAWKNEAPNSYGVVEITGQDKGEWADGHMIDQTFRAEITLYVAGNSMKWVHRIQEKLEEMDAGYSIPERRWLPDIKKTAWVWQATFYCPLEWAEPAEV
jgi:hypothetical protein